GRGAAGAQTRAVGALAGQWHHRRDHRTAARGVRGVGDGDAGRHRGRVRPGAWVAGSGPPSVVDHGTPGAGGTGTERLLAAPGSRIVLRPSLKRGLRATVAVFRAQDRSPDREPLGRTAE